MSKDLEYTISGDDSPLRQALARVQSNFKETQAGASNMLAGLQGAFGTLNKMIAGVTAALAGGAAIKSAVDATKAFTGESNKLARVLAISATEASTLNVALGDIYTDADTFTAAAAKMAKELRTNESALTAMGLQTRDAQGNLRPLKDLMLDSITVINSYKQGTDRNIASQIAWGKGADEMSALLKLNNGIIDEAKKKQEELGLVVGVENVANTKAYKAAMNDVGDVMLGIKKVIGDAVMPVLTQLGEWFTAIGPAAVLVVKGAVGGLVAVFWGLKNSVQIVWETFAGFIETVTVGMVGVGTGFYKILTGDLMGGVAAFQGATDAIKNIWSTRVDNMVASSQQAQDKILGLFGNPTATAAPSDKGRSAAGLVKSGKDDSMMAQWEAELNALKQAHANQNAEDGTFFEFSKERDKEFWEKKRQIAAAGSKDAFAVQAKITAATLELQKESFEQQIAGYQRQQAAAEQDFKAREDLVKKELALITEKYGADSKQGQDAARKLEDVQRQGREQRRTLREQDIAETAAGLLLTEELERQHQKALFDAGLSTRAQQLASEQEFEANRFEIQKQALLERQALIDPTLNPVEYARLKNEILQLERQHQLQMGELQNARALENSANLRTMVGSMESSWAGTIKGMLQGTVSLTQGIRGLFRGVVDAVIGMLAQMAAKWMAQQLLMAVFGKATALATITEKAAEAGAGGVASMAAAPFPLNLSAPSFGAAMSLAAMAFAPVASASQGYDIPAGINPIVQTHAREMILPEEQADVVRDLASSGGGRSGGDTYYINALDARSFEQFARDNPAGFAAGVQAARRRGHLS